MKHIIILLILFCSVIVHASEHRSFTSKDGRTINAKILKVNKATKKVTLLKENGKQVTVPIGLFSEADQTHIDSWTPFSSSKKKSSSGIDGIASEDQLILIAEKYAKACAAKDLEALKPLFHAWNEENLSSTRPSLHFTEKVRVKKVDGNICEVKVQESGSFGGYRYIQFLPSGKIKYDAILFKHPVYDAFFSYEQTICEINSTQYDIRHLRNDITDLRKTGIPMFSLSANQPRHEQLKSLERIKEWLLKDGETWDKTDPKLPMPPELFEEYRKRHK